MMFGPTNDQEAYEFALEELRADIQYEVLRGLKQADLSQAQLAQKIGVSPAWISQILGDDANLTLESIVKVFLGLGNQCKVTTFPVGEHFCAAPVASNAAAVEGWKEASRPADRRAGDVARRASDTAAMLMSVIEANCSKRVRMTVNDNTTRKVVRQLEVA